MSPAVIAAAGASVAVLFGLGDQEYGYYQFLRLLLTGVSLFLWLGNKRDSNTWQPWLLGGIAALYNPILPIQIGDKSAWSVLNVITLAAFWTVIYVDRRDAEPYVSSSSPEIPTDLTRGQIVRLLLHQGFGFARDSRGVECVFHRSAVRGSVFELMREGQHVEFAVEQTDKGPRAHFVRLIAD